MKIENDTQTAGNSQYCGNEDHVDSQWASQAMAMATRPTISSS